MQRRDGHQGAGWARLALPVLLAVASLGLADLALAQQGYVNAPKPWELDLQESSTLGMDKLKSLHNWLLVIITLICLFVLALLAYVMVRFRASRNPVPSTMTHHTLLEVAWTVIPILILIGIAIPSFRLLYFTDKTENPELTVKVIGHQWYWSYEYPDHKNPKGEAVAIDSRMIPEKDIDKAKGQIRLLSVDQPLVVPVDTNVRVLMTTEDVMHGWAVPAFGMKRTLVPGRINETWFNVRREGTFYGQCSQICGVNHAYMPIAVRVVSKDEFKKWIEGRRATAALPVPNTDMAAAATVGR